MPLRPSPLLSLRLPKPTLLFRPFSSTPSRAQAKMSIVGRLAAEPEVIPTASGTDLVKYAIGTQHGPRDNRQTTWWKVAAFPSENQKEALTSLGKGSLLYVEGSCEMRKFQDREGTDRSTLSITQ
ncbi:MAG: hypothetical protein Q9170_008322, partial [Blastenia crenularia]